MRKITLLLVWLIGCLTTQAQTIVTLGAPSNGAGSTNVLLSTSTTTNKYSKTISIYTASEIAAAGGFAGDIVSVGWDKQGTGEYIFGDALMVIYMKQVSNATWSPAPDWNTEVATATQVFSSSTFSIPTGTGWKTINFTTPFQWDGSSNVAVFVEWYRPSTPTADIDWGRSTQTSANATRVGSSSALVLSVNSNRPLAQLGILPATPCTTPPLAGIAQASVTDLCPGGNVTLSLSGNSYGTGQTYQWEQGPSVNGPWTPEGAANTSPAIVVTPPTGTTYYRCQVTCGTSSVASAPDTVVVWAPFSGAYTINANQPASATNFQSFSKVFSLMSCAGISGPVSLTVAPGSGPYNEQLIIDSIPGVSAANPIVIDGNGVTISNSASASTGGLRPTVKFNGADYVTLKNFVIDALGGTYGWGIQIGYGAAHDSILNCTINVSSTSTTQSSSAGIVANGSETTVTTDGSFQDIAIIGNTITGAYQGIIMNASSANRASGIYIANNVLKDFHSDGIIITECNGAQIVNNDFSRPLRTSTASTATGIELGAGNTHARVIKNKIHGTHTSTTSQTGAMYGIHLSSCDAPPTEENIIANNLIYDFNSLTGTQNALRNTGSNGAFFYNNTVVLDHQASTSGTTYAFYQTTSASNIEVKNNVFYITRGGGGNKHLLYFNTAASTIASDNNVLYMGSTGGNNFIGRSSATDYANLAAWQGINFDLASSDQDPFFLNPLVADFTTTNPLVNNIALPNAFVLDDINGSPRSTTAPDPGAFENTSFPLDVNLLAFNATKENSDVTLTWDVADEKNMSVYEVERSENGRSFTKIGTVKARGNSAEATYRYMDNGALSESAANTQLYYRLKMVEENATYQYSPVQLVRTDATISGLSASPNPFNEKITVRLDSKEAGTATVSLIDMQGRVLTTQSVSVQKGANSLEINNLAHLPSAVYHLVIDINGVKQTQRIVK